MSLINLGPLHKTLTINGHDHKIRGISAEGIFMLLANFPEIQKLLQGQLQELKAGTILHMIPQSLSTVIAISMLNRSDYPTFNDWELAVQELAKETRDMGAGLQVRAFNMIFELTFGEEGARPFEGDIKKLMLNLGGQDLLDKLSMQQDTLKSSLNTNASSTGNATAAAEVEADSPRVARDMRSPARYGSALQVGTIPKQIMRGRTLPEHLVSGLRLPKTYAQSGSSTTLQ
jgi:hypothetical protein